MHVFNIFGFPSCWMASRTWITFNGLTAKFETLVRKSLNCSLIDSLPNIHHFRGDISFFQTNFCGLTLRRILQWCLTTDRATPLSLHAYEVHFPMNGYQVMSPWRNLCFRESKGLNTSRTDSHEYISTLIFYGSFLSYLTNWGWDIFSFSPRHFKVFLFLQGFFVLAVYTIIKVKCILYRLLTNIFFTAFITIYEMSWLLCKFTVRVRSHWKIKSRDKEISHAISRKRIQFRVFIGTYELSKWK